MVTEVSDDNFGSLNFFNLENQILRYNHTQRLEFNYESVPSLKYVSKGKINYIINGQRVSLREGNFLFVEGGIKMKTMISQPVEGTTIFFKKGNLTEGGAIPSFPIIGNEVNSTFGQLLMKSETTYAIVEAEQEVRNYFDLLAPYLDKLKLRRYNVRVDLLWKLLKARDQIENSLKCKLELDELAKECCLSKYYLIRRFKEIFGITPYQYYQELKINDSKKELLNGKTLNEIAIIYDIADAFSYSKIFKQVTGISPSQFISRSSPNNLEQGVN